ncbi:MAG TPA: iron-containing alcohol dehydrogenase [Anaeromyxobacter sp.]|nr:iron-containing alcohol dehydrogenase [Anaeromyxobacter sp.]
MSLYHEEFLARFGGGEAPACACGRIHRVTLREAIVGPGALEESAERLSRGPWRATWVLSDGNTEAAAGARWKGLVRGKRVRGRVLPAAPRPVPTEALVSELAAEAREASPDLVVAVGSGVVSDLGKAIAGETGRPSWSIATAGSVDAYTSATSAIRVAGYHTPVPVPPSEVVVCDASVIAEAPRRLFWAGLGDLLAKYLARVDWFLAHAVTGEYFCEAVSALALGSARRAIEAASLLASDPAAAAIALSDASLVSGLCMQAIGSSRPAAAAEHTIAHFWEMAGAAQKEEFDLHGLLVGAASRPILGGYLALAPRLRAAEVDPAARREALEREPPWEAVLPPELIRFRATIEAVVRSSEAGRPSPETRLRAFSRRREEILNAADPVLRELEAAVKTLERLGFPFSPAELGIAEPWLRLGVRHVRWLRDRYTTFDLAHDLGEEPMLAAAVEAALATP